MITPEMLESLPYQPMQIASRLQNAIIEHIVSDLGAFDKISSMADYENRIPLMIKQFDTAINEYVNQYNGDLINTLTDMFIALVIGDMLTKDQAKKAGIVYLPYERDRNVQNIAQDSINDTYNHLKLDVKDIGITDTVNGKAVFEPLAPIGYQPTISKSGAYQRTFNGVANDYLGSGQDYNTVIRNIVKRITDSGIRTVTYRDGSGNITRTDNINVVVRRSVLFAIKQQSQLIEEYNAQKAGVTTWEISWHSGYRPTHGWGGRRFTTKDIDDIDPQTGSKYPLETELYEMFAVDGEIGTLDDYNCYHTKHWIFPWDTPLYSLDELEERDKTEKALVKYGDKLYNKYEARQRQRELEVKMRAVRLEADGYKAAGLEDDFMTKRALYQRYRQEYKKFTDAMGLKTEYERVYYDRLGKIGGKVTPVFNSTARLEYHFDKHVIKRKEFGNITIEEYNDLAKKFFKRNSGIEEFTIKGDTIHGNIKFLYDESKNEFGVIKESGIIETFFKPKNKTKYWNNQKEKYKEQLI